ncbi:MAG: pantetheine-phosphate adenylyltransferase [Candidatus Levyibacteriota bacterium]
MKYRLVVCGGTFDKFHQGHKDFLDFVINLGDRVILGLTSDLYIQQYKNGLGIEPFEMRKKVLENHLESLKKKDAVEIISIDDHFGPTLSNEYVFDSLAVTSSTEEMGAQINTEREKKGMQPLPLEVFTLTLAEDGKPITSTRIRNGLIDRDGKPYIKKEWLEHSLMLPQVLREELAKPLGEIIQDVPLALDSSKTITVGDMVTKTFRDKNIQPKLSVIDNKIERSEHPFDLKGFDGNILEIKNPAGTVSSELTNEILRLSKKDGARKEIIVIDGEEDLAVLPVLLAFPLGFHVFYGQPGKGMVQIIISEEIKNKARAFLQQFETS